MNFVALPLLFVISALLVVLLSVKGASLRISTFSQEAGLLGFALLV